MLRRCLMLTNISFSVSDVTLGTRVTVLNCNIAPAHVELSPKEKSNLITEMIN